MMSKPVFKGEILLCEDNVINQELIHTRLTKMGLEITMAENGKEGVEKTEYRVRNGIKPFDLIFMDIYMPVMDGLEAADTIGKMKTGTPIIALTANVTPADREQYAAHGMTECLNKPFTSRELSDCLSKYLTPVSHGSEPYRESQDDENLKKKLINLFIIKNKNFYKEISKAIGEENIKQAHLMAHTLKSNAAMLGKTSLQSAAMDVEDLLKNEENRTNQAAMDTLKTELDAVLNEFKPLRPDQMFADISGAARPGVVIDKTETQILFDELETMLDGGDTRCLELIDNLRLIPGTGELIHQIEYFEFHKAKETLARLK